MTKILETSERLEGYRRRYDVNRIEVDSAMRASVGTMIDDHPFLVQNPFCARHSHRLASLAPAFPVNLGWTSVGLESRSLKLLCCVDTLGPGWSTVGLIVSAGSSRLSIPHTPCLSFGLQTVVHTQIVSRIFLRVGK